MAQTFTSWRPDGKLSGDVVIYVHGYYDDVDSAITKHSLFDQFKASGRKAIFIVVEAPTNSSQKVAWPSLQELLEVTHLTGAQSVTVVFHSGGYRTVVGWLANPKIKHLVMLDAAYGNVQPFITWGQKIGHKIDVVGYSTSAKSRQIAVATGTQYHQASGHMAIVEDGYWIPKLLWQPKPKSNAVLWAVGIGTGLSIGYLFLKRRRKN